MKDIIKKVYIALMMIPLIIDIILFRIIDNNQYKFSFIVDIFCLCISISIGVLTIFRGRESKCSFYTNLGFGYYLIAFLYLCKIVIYGVFDNCSVIINILITTIIYVINIFFILSALLGYRNSRRVSRLIFLITFLFISGYSILCVLYFQKSVFNMFATIILNFVVIDILCGLKEIREHFHWYIIFMMTYINFEILFEINILLNGKVKFYCDIFMYLSFFIMINIVREKFYYESYLVEEKKLREVEKNYISLNKILVKKNKQLVEMKKCIEKSENRKRHLFNQVKDGIIIVTFNKITYINEKIRKFFIDEFDKDFIGESINDLYYKLFSKNIVVKNHAIKIANLYSSKIKEGCLYRICDMEINGRDFSIFFFKLNSGEGVLYCKDISYVNKSHKIRSEYDEYLKEEKLKDDFYSNISHELRTPINIIYSAIQLNSLYLEEHAINKIIDNNNLVKQNCLRLIRTINNFIDTNKVSEGYLKPRFKIQNIVYVVENIANACNRYLEKIDNLLIFDSEEEELYANIDKEMIERVIMNLLSNMVKYGERGAEVNINIYSKDDIIIEVKHNLYTISDEIKPFIFDKFSKLNKSLNREREGCGLGLFLSKALVELQGGKIRVESNKEEGTKFIINIPKCEDIDLSLIEFDEEARIEDINNKVDTEFSDIYL